MIGSKKRYASWFCPAITALFLFSGCLAGQQRAVVIDQGSFTEYKHDNEAGTKEYLADSQANEITYVDDTSQQEVLYVAKKEGLTNFKVLAAHKTIIPAMKALLIDPELSIALSQF